MTNPTPESYLTSIKVEWGSPDYHTETIAVHMPADGSLAIVPFARAEDPGSIRYRLAPADVGFDLREDDTIVRIMAKPTDVIRVSFSRRYEGRRMVACGDAASIVALLEACNYEIDLVDPPLD